MGTPFSARFSFVVFARCLSYWAQRRRFARKALLRAGSNVRIHSIAAPATSTSEESLDERESRWHRTASRTIRRPPLSSSECRLPRSRQNQKAKKMRSGITIRSQSCRRKYRLSIKRLPNCRPLSKARRSMNRCTTAGIESVAGKSNCISLQTKRQDTLDKIAALEDEARHNGVATNELH